MTAADKPGYKTDTARSIPKPTGASRRRLEQIKGAYVEEMVKQAEEEQRNVYKITRLVCGK